MNFQVEAFLDRWAYDPAATLWNVIDSHRDDLFSDDRRIRDHAASEILELLSWFLPPLEELSETERDAALVAIATDPRLSTQERMDAALHITRGKQRAAGRRPTMRHFALPAYTMYLRTGRSWREIALEVLGSCAQRKCDGFCASCGDVDRQKVERSPLTLRRELPRCSSCTRTIRAASKREKVCHRCTDAVRDLVGKLERLLVSLGYEQVPRR